MNIPGKEELLLYYLNPYTSLHFQKTSNNNNNNKKQNSLQILGNSHLKTIVG